MGMTKAEIRALADKLSNTPEQQKIAKEWGDEMYAESLKDTKEETTK